MYVVISHKIPLFRSLHAFLSKLATSLHPAHVPGNRSASLGCPFKLASPSMHLTSFVYINAQANLIQLFCVNICMQRLPWVRARWSMPKSPRWQKRQSRTCRKPFGCAWAVFRDVKLSWGFRRPSNVYAASFDNIGRMLRRRRLSDYSRNSGAQSGAEAAAACCTRHAYSASTRGSGAAALDQHNDSWFRVGWRLKMYAGVNSH